MIYLIYINLFLNILDLLLIIFCDFRNILIYLKTFYWIMEYINLYLLSNIILTYFIIIDFKINIYIN